MVIWVSIFQVPPIVIFLIPDVFLSLDGRRTPQGGWLVGLTLLLCERWKTRNNWSPGSPIPRLTPGEKTHLFCRPREPMTSEEVVFVDAHYPALGD